MPKGREDLAECLVCHCLRPAIHIPPRPAKADSGGKVM
jgi:hypothetical protein